jgi:citrate synthase
MRLAATLEFLRAIDYPFPDWTDEYMNRMEETLGTRTRSRWRTCAATSTTCARRVGEPRPPAVSSISQAYPDRVEVRGRDLTGELMGRVGFTAYFHLLLTGSEPTDEQLEFLDLMLVAIAEHGLMPSNVAARMTLAADPESLQGAVAAGILGAGPLLLGTSGECARLLAGAREAGRTAAEVASELHAAGERVPASAIPCTARSTPALSGSSSWRTHAVSAARTSPSPGSCATPSPRRGGGRCR